MYKCYECGHVFDDEDVKRWSEDRGKCHGVPAYEEYCGCPACNGDFEEAVCCEVCGEWFLKSDLSQDYICTECIEKKASDFDFAYNAFNKHKESIEINGLLAGIFTEWEIEEILRTHYKEHLQSSWINKTSLHFNHHKQVAMECPEIISEAMDEEIRENLKKGVK